MPTKKKPYKRRMVEDDIIANNDLKKKKLTKKQKEKVSEEFRLKFAKDNLEHKKRVYETYLKALVEYNIENVAYAAIGYEELFQKELQRKLEHCIRDKTSFMKEMFGDPKATELEKVNSSIEYYDKLISVAQMKIKNMTYDKKMKIAKDAVEKCHHWLRFSSENYQYEKDKLPEACGKCAGCKRGSGCLEQLAFIKKQEKKK